MCWVLVVNSAFSQALPVSRMQSAISGIIQNKAIKRGFAANDPRFIGTLRDVSSGMAGTAAAAAAVTAAGVTAPAWLTVALAAGVGTLVTYGVSLAIDGVTKWLFKTSTVDIPGTNGQVDSSNGMTKGGPYYVAQGSRSNAQGQILSVTVYGTDGLAAGLQAASSLGYAAPVTCSYANGTSNVRCTASNGATATSGYYNSSGAPATCPKGTAVISTAGTGCTTYSYPYAQPGATPAQTDVAPATAVSNIPAADLQKQVSPDLLANIANAAWRNAASQPNYSGVPYAVADPITADEVNTWKASNPDRYPTVSDAAAPQDSANSPWQLPVSPTATTQPAAYPSTGSNPASSQPLENLGPDPGVGAPTLEQTPTADEILKPVFDLLPGFKNYTVPTHSAECPKPQFHLFDQDFVMDAQCTIAENNRSTIAALMMAVWAILACFIVLRA
jgi:hypothetical protein